jgi:hypothetical protein
MVPAETILNYQAKGITQYFQSADQVAQDMNPILSQQNITIRDFHTTVTGIVGSVDAYLGGPADFQLTASLQTSADFGAVADIQSIVDNSIYQITGKLPVSTIPGITVPGNAPAITGSPAQALASATSSLTGTASNWFSNIFQSGINSFALLMVGVILAVVLIVAGKNKGMSVI